MVHGWGLAWKKTWRESTLCGPSSWPYAKGWSQSPGMQVWGFLPTCCCHCSRVAIYMVTYIHSDKCTLCSDIRLWHHWVSTPIMTLPPQAPPIMTPPSQAPPIRTAFTGSTHHDSTLTGSTHQNSTSTGSTLKVPPLQAPPTVTPPQGREGGSRSQCVRLED